MKSKNVSYDEHYIAKKLVPSIELRGKRRAIRGNDLSWCASMQKKYLYLSMGNEKELAFEALTCCVEMERENMWNLKGPTAASAQRVGWYPPNPRHEEYRKDVGAEENPSAGFGF